MALRLAATLTLLCATLAAPALANPRLVSFTDPAGDASPVGDVVGAQLSFDSATGAWTVTWQAAAAHPFTGNARFDLNLFDTTLAPFSSNSFPQVSLDADMNFGAGTATQFSYSGTTPFLTNWQIGDTISTGNGTRFYSTEVALDVVGRDIMITTAPVTGSDPARAIPEPATLAMLLAGMGLLGWTTLRRRTGKPLVW
jgi:hypothetical protein